MWGKVLADYLRGMFFICFSFCLDNEIKLAGKSQVLFSEFHALIWLFVSWQSVGWMEMQPFSPCFQKKEAKVFFN